MKFIASSTLAIALGLIVVGCGESYTESENTVDTREVTKQAEPQAPSLKQRIEAPVNLTIQEAPTLPKTTEVEMRPQIASGSALYTSCAGCHGVTGEGGVGPKLKGQNEEDLISKMILYRAGEQVGPLTGMMAPMVKDMSDEDIERVVKFILTF
ncbi:c-type cytochrome [Thiomicrospira sp. R3]|uniref:c-type cytochrome n=1 Tax=Thiomicrospira sp. R3 TaxID=3035472 RepID=UPI00259AEEF7|nr:c-type cytochrome [Thiomicrospira sp. R3]WFE68461.1 c-type cytochrome [Thiomicrospira sp. R3]